MQVILYLLFKPNRLVWITKIEQEKPTSNHKQNRVSESLPTEFTTQ